MRDIIVNINEVRLLMSKIFTMVIIASFYVYLITYGEFSKTGRFINLFDDIVWQNLFKKVHCVAYSRISINLYQIT